MKFNALKLTALTITACLALGLTACGGGGAAPNSDAGGESAGSAAQPAATGDVVTINFPSIWVGADSKAEVFGKMIAGFNEEFAGKYEVKVEEQTDYDAYRDKIRTLISTGSAPDIFTVQDQADLDMYAQSGKLMDLTAFFEDADIAGRFAAGELERGIVDGKRYAFPYESAVIPVMYNQKLLDAAGVESVPSSYDELWDACEKLTASGVSATAQMTNNNAWTSMLWYSYALAACGGEDVFEKGLDDPAYVQAAELVQKMFGYTHSDAVGGDANVPNGHFFNERAAIYTNGTWILGRIKTEGVEGLYDNMTVGAGWSQNGQNGGAVVATTQAYLCAGNDESKREAIEEFIRYITVEERVTELANSSGALFAVQIDPANIEDAKLGEIIELSNNCSFRIQNFQGAMPTAVANAFPSALEALVLGDVDPQGFVDLLKAANA